MKNQMKVLWVLSMMANAYATFCFFLISGLGGFELRLSISEFLGDILSYSGSLLVLFLNFLYVGISLKRKREGIFSESERSLFLMWIASLFAVFCFFGISVLSAGSLTW